MNGAAPPRDPRLVEKAKAAEYWMKRALDAEETARQLEARNAMLEKGLVALATTTAASATTAVEQPRAKRPRTETAAAVGFTTLCEIRCDKTREELYGITGFLPLSVQVKLRTVREAMEFRNAMRDKGFFAWQVHESELRPV